MKIIILQYSSKFKFQFFYKTIRIRIFHTLMKRHPQECSAFLELSSKKLHTPTSNKASFSKNIATNISPNRKQTWMFNYTMIPRFIANHNLPIERRKICLLLFFSE